MKDQQTGELSLNEKKGIEGRPERHSDTRGEGPYCLVNWGKATSGKRRGSEVVQTPTQKSPAEDSKENRQA